MNKEKSEGEKMFIEIVNEITTDSEIDLNLDPQIYSNTLNVLHNMYGQHFEGDPDVYEM